MCQTGGKGIRRRYRVRMRSKIANDCTSSNRERTAVACENVDAAWCGRQVAAEFTGPWLLIQPDIFPLVNYLSNTRESMGDSGVD